MLDVLEAQQPGIVTIRVESGVVAALDIFHVPFSVMRIAPHVSIV